MDEPVAPPPNLLAAVMRASEKYEVPVRLLLGVAWVGSRYHVHARSDAGEGPFQMTSLVRRAVVVNNPYDIDYAADGVAKFLRLEFDRFAAGRAPVAGWRIALASYRWGRENASANPLPQRWPMAIRRYTDEVRRASNAVPLPAVGVDITVISGPERPASPLAVPQHMPLDGLRRAAFARSL